jgi:hypothetical protein
MVHVQADLLTLAFSEAIEAEVFYRFLRRQIVEYLRGAAKRRTVWTALQLAAQGMAFSSRFIVCYMW